MSASSRATRWQLQSRDWLHNAYVVERKSTTAIGRELGCGASTVGKALVRLGVPARTAVEVAAIARERAVAARSSAPAPKPVESKSARERRSRREVERETKRAELLEMVKRGALTIRFATSAEERERLGIKASGAEVAAAARSVAENGCDRVNGGHDA